MVFWELVLSMTVSKGENAKPLWLIILNGVKPFIHMQGKKILILELLYVLLHAVIAFSLL